jgi:DNA mismatch repair protein MutL
MQQKVRILSEQLCNKIAAGEVVERPASVIKELIENSLDAGADEIFLDIEAGGRKLIRIRDNGSGMSRDDAFLSLERHATSKISNDEDLFRLTTLGFRGEALPSIAAVSRFVLQTRDQSSEEGFRIKVSGGNVEYTEAVGMTVGTDIEVRNLFFNTPARRKFLRTEQTEIGHIADVVNRQAMARPEVRFRLSHNGRVLIDAFSVSRLNERVSSLLDRQTAEGMLELTQSEGDLALHGLIAEPDRSRASTAAIYSYINGRFIRDRVVQHAIMQGYRTLMPKGRYPIAILFLDLPPELVDVNVHPSKHEVRFRDQRSVHDFIVQSIRNRLRGEKGVTGETFHERSLSIPVKVQSDTVVPSVSIQESFPVYRTPLVQPAPGAHDVDAKSVAPFTFPATEETLAGPFSSLTVIGQFHNSYLVCQDRNELVLIDQHAAHERIGFERLRKQFSTQGIIRQDLMFPVVMEYDLKETTQLGQNLDILARFGFDVEPFGGNSFVLKSVPQLMVEAEAEQLVRDVAAELGALGESALLDEALDHILMTVACHGSVRANQSLSTVQMQALLRELDQVDFNGHCPHGRPVIQRLPLSEIERMFKRA